MSSCDERVAGLIDQRYVFGPYDVAFWVVLESVTLWDSESPDRRKSALRLLPVDPKLSNYEPEIQPAIARALNDPRVTLYRLPPGHVAIIELREVPGQGFLFDVQQLPPADRAAIYSPGKCSGNCPPNTIFCPVGEVPDCSTGRLKCIPLT